MYIKWIANLCSIRWNTVSVNCRFEELPPCPFAFVTYHILSSIVRTFFIENDAEILPVYYTWKVAVTNQNNKQSIPLKLYSEGAHNTHMQNYTQ